MQNGRCLAAVDLGSNSFRLEHGSIEDGQFYRKQYMKETVRLGGNIDENGKLTTDAMQRGWDCLARFGCSLSGFNDQNVLAVATQTLREAHNRDEFLLTGSIILGFPIRLITGNEEAKLIYQGVSQALASSTERRLVIDIGGRSTELIVGQGLMPDAMDSFHMGSISWSMQYFQGNVFTQQSFEMAETAVKAVLGHALSRYQSQAWDTAYGSAGTVSAVSDVLAAANWPVGSVNRDGLDWLQDKLLTAQSAERLCLPGMREDRKAIIGGGLCILRSLFDLLGIKQLEQAAGGLRHGLLLDLMGASR